MRDVVVAALEEHFAAGRPRGSRLFRTELDRLGLYESNITQISYDRQRELVERWRSTADEMGVAYDSEDERTMLWIDGLLAALALVEKGVLP